MVGEFYWLELLLPILNAQVPFSALKFFVPFVSSSRQLLEQYLKMGHDHLLAHPF